LNCLNVDANARQREGQKKITPAAGLALTLEGRKKQSKSRLARWSASETEFHRKGAVIMIGRASAAAVAIVYERIFSTGYENERVNLDRLHDSFFGLNYPPWILTKTRSLFTPRELKDFIMYLQMGKGVDPCDKQLGDDERRSQGQEILKKLIEDSWSLMRIADAREGDRIGSALVHLIRCLELDGYKYDKGRITPSEVDVLDTKETADALAVLYGELGIGEKEMAINHLDLSAEHYRNGKWGDCIGNARHFFECVLRNVAADYSTRYKGTPFPEKDFKKPVLVRQHLEKEGLLSFKEVEAIDKVYGVVSEAGGHPNMAENEHARILRQLALILAQFVMLRYQNHRKENP
jgi:hypothetical protein